MQAESAFSLSVSFFILFFGYLLPSPKVLFFLLLKRASRCAQTCKLPVLYSTVLSKRAAKQRTRGKDHSYEAPNRQANAYSEPGPIPGVPRPVILQNQTKVETIHDQKKQMSAI